jgi:hypothetical protein
MSFDVEQYVCYRIANAPVLRHPFPHFYVESVFPDDFYRDLRARLPALDGYKRIDETGSVAKGDYQARYVCSLTELEEREFEQGRGTFWMELNRWLAGDEFARTILDKFQFALPQRFGSDVETRIETDNRLVRDFTTYAIAPHTDSPRKLVSLLFYLPPDDSMRHLGTSIYAPKDPSFRCEGTAHHSFEGFKRVATMAYRPNTLFGFFKTNRAFHGVEPIAEEKVERDLLLYNIYLAKLVRRAAPADRKAFAWPWQKA